MANRENSTIEITPEVLLKAYACGIFPLAGFPLPARLARTVRASPFTVWVDRDFDAVIDGCAEAKPDRARTWRSEEHTSKLQSRQYLVCRLLLEKKKKIKNS